MSTEGTKIIVVFKTHFDIGFTALAKDVIDMYGKRMLPDVIQTCEGTESFGKGHRYVWTMSAWPLIQGLQQDNVDENTIKSAKTLLERKQIDWHALPFTTHTEFCGLEEFIRGMYFSRTLSERYGRWPQSAKMTDVPGHTWILPSLLYKAGVRFLHLGCNPACTSPDVPRLFFWEGPDGNKVLTFYSKGSYGSSLTPPKDWTFPVWLALMQTGDNIGPQKPEVIEEMLEQVEKEMPGTELLIGTLDDFYDNIKSYVKDIPTIRGDLADTWIHGIGTYPREVSTLRGLRSRLTNTEKQLSIGVLKKLFLKQDLNQMKKSVETAYENCILFGEHTWGLDVKSYLSHNRQYKKELFLKEKSREDYKKMEQSWNEQRERVNIAEKIVNDVSLYTANSIAEAVNIDSHRITVFNGLPWERDAWVNLELYNVGLLNKEIIDSENNINIETSYINGKLHGYFKGIPALGYKAYSIKNKEMSCEEKGSIYVNKEMRIIENKWYRIELDFNNGGIRSLKDKATGREWIDNSSYAFGQYRYDIYGDEDITEFLRTYSYRFFDWSVNDLGRIGYPSQEHLVFTPEGYDFEVNEEKNSATVIYKTVIDDESLTEYGNASSITTNITLYDNQPYIDFCYNIKGKEETPFVEAGHFVFPVNMKKPKVYINKLGSVLDPSVDIIKNANNMLYCCENWVEVTDGQCGMAIIPYDSPLFSIGEQGIYKFRGEHKEEKPILFFNCFNNSWGTNFPQWMGADYTFRYRILLHEGDWKQGNVQKHALESINPFIIGISSYNAKDENKQISLPTKFQLIKDLDGMDILTLKPAEEGEGFILRLRDVKGEKRQIVLSFSLDFKSIYECGLLEQNRKLLAYNGKEVNFTTNCFEIHTFYIEF